jgi:tight adherence protein B
VDRSLHEGGRREALARSLAEAGVSTAPGDLVAGVAAGAVGGGLLGALVGGPALALLVLAGVPAGTYLVVARRRRTRRERFAEQVLTLLPTLAASLRAGHSLLQALELAGQELAAPGGEEIRRVSAELQLGRDMADALSDVAERYDCEDLRWVVGAIEIHREVGGDLAQVLDRVTETIRSRDHLRREVKALTAEGRASAKVLSVLPIALGLLLAVTNPSYLGTFTSSGLGVALLGIAVVMMAVGTVWLRAVSRVEV